MEPRKARLIGYWAATIVTALLFAVPGTALVMKAPHFVSEMARLGYPAYFLTLFGLLKICGAAIVLAPGLPRLKEWAYAGLMFDAVFATFSRSAIGDTFIADIAPAAIGALVLLSWALRPDRRKLAATPSRS